MPTKNRFFHITFVLQLLVIFLPVQASQNEQRNCWVKAANHYNVDPWLLYAISEVESAHKQFAMNYNETTRDIGLMQINSWHLPKLNAYGITEMELLRNPCTNIMIGAWVLAHSFKVFGRTWEGVGAYNAGTAKTVEQQEKRLVYALKVRTAYVSNQKKFNYRLQNLPLKQE